MSAPSDVLVISGIPGAGKTTYTRWLEERGWGCLRMDDRDQDDRLVRAIYEENDGPLLETVQTHGAGFVVEWGFHVTQLAQVGSMIRRGYNAWYFDGDATAALASWKQQHKLLPSGVFQGQLDLLKAHMDEIRELYHSKFIATVTPGPTHPPCEKIHQLLGFG